MRFEEPAGSTRKGAEAEAEAKAEADDVPMVYPVMRSPATQDDDASLLMTSWSVQCVAMPDANGMTPPWQHQP